MKHLRYSRIFRQLLTTAGDSIFPPTESEILLRSLTDLDIINLYQPNNYLNIRYVSEYTNKSVRTAVTENKFCYSKQAALVLGKLLTQWLSDQSDSVLLVPIPLGSQRLRERGHNQVETIIKAATITQQNHANILKRSTETLPQSQLDKTHRRKNIKNAFKYVATNLDFSQYSQVVLIDDVATTGSTLNEARATLAPHLPPHIKLTCLALAH